MYSQKETPKQIFPPPTFLSVHYSFPPTPTPTHFISCSLSSVRKQSLNSNDTIGGACRKQIKHRRGTQHSSAGGSILKGMRHSCGENGGLGWLASPHLGEKDRLCQIKAGISSLVSDLGDYTSEGGTCSKRITTLQKNNWNASSLCISQLVNVAMGTSQINQEEGICFFLQLNTLISCLSEQMLRLEINPRREMKEFA